MCDFLVKVVNRSYIYIYVTRIRKMLISYVRLDHTLYSINYGTSTISLVPRPLPRFQRYT